MFRIVIKFYIGRHLPNTTLLYPGLEPTVKKNGKVWDGSVTSNVDTKLMANKEKA